MIPPPSKKKNKKTKKKEKTLRSAPQKTSNLQQWS